MKNIFIKPLKIINFKEYKYIRNNLFNFTNDKTIKKLSDNEIKNNILQNIESNNIIRFGIFNSDNMIGYITLGNITNINCTLHICIDTKYQNIGYGTKSIEKIIFFCENFLNLKTITLDVMKNNNAIKLYKKFNFKIFKTHEKYYSMILYL